MVYKSRIFAFNSIIDIITNDIAINQYIEDFYYLKEYEPSDSHITFTIMKTDINYITEMNGNINNVSYNNIYLHISTTINNAFINHNVHSLFFHAAAFKFKDYFFILMNHSGAGKTTMLAAALKSNLSNISYISDDIVMVNCKEKTINGLPCGLRIKSGSYNKYFSGYNLQSYPNEDGSVWIFKPNNKIEPQCYFYSFSRLIFVNVKYNENADFMFSHINGTKSIHMLINNSYNIKNNTSNIVKNMFSFENSLFYSLEYANLEKALECLLNSN